jgi:excisionase family DNA binding protein
MESGHHAPSQKPKAKRGPRKRRELAPVCVSPTEFAETTGISRPTIYRMMRDGTLKFAQPTSGMRKIPVSEYARLGLCGDAA